MLEELPAVRLAAPEAEKIELVELKLVEARATLKPAALESPTLVVTGAA